MHLSGTWRNGYSLEAYGAWGFQWRCFSPSGSLPITVEIYLFRYFLSSVQRRKRAVVQSSQRDRSADVARKSLEMKFAPEKRRQASSCTSSSLTGGNTVTGEWNDCRAGRTLYEPLDWSWDGVRADVRYIAAHDVRGSGAQDPCGENDRPRGGLVWSDYREDLIELLEDWVGSLGLSPNGYADEQHTDDDEKGLFSHRNLQAKLQASLVWRAAHLNAKSSDGCRSWRTSMRSLDASEREGV